MKTHTVALNGIEMFYETDGSGEPLLLLHGGGGCHDDWSYAGRDEFVRHYALIAPDARDMAARPIRPEPSRTGSALQTLLHCWTI